MATRIVKILLLLFMIFLVNGCVALYVNSTVGEGVQPQAREEMIKYEKDLRAKNRRIDKAHKIRKRNIEKQQNKKLNYGN